MAYLRHILATEIEGAEEPVTLEEVKAWARIDHNDEDDVLEAMITSARKDIEAETNLKLVPHNVVAYADYSAGNSFVLLYYGTPTDVVIKEGEVTQNLNDDYYLNGNEIELNYYGKYSITYKVGATVPADLKEAIKMLVAYRYAHRGDQDKSEQQGMPADILRKIENRRSVVL